MSLATPTAAHVLASQTAARDVLVEALMAAGRDASRAAPDTPTDASAWPQWAGTPQTGGHLCRPALYTFSVYCVLPAGEPETTVLAGDALAETIPPYLAKVADVAIAEPVVITFGNGTTMPGIRFRVTVR